MASGDQGASISPCLKIGDLVKEHGLVTVEYKVGRTRSKFQQAALEVWCRQTADLFNEQEIARSIKSPIFKQGEMEAPLVARGH